MRGLYRFKHLGLALLAACLVAACGGGDDAGPGGSTPPPPPPDGGGGGTVLTAGVPGLVGDWLENGCVASGFQSFKRLVRAAQSTTATSITYSEGVVMYGSINCSGAGSVVGPSRLGEVVFSRSESNARVAANWGQFTTITGTRSAAIWAKKSETVLCLLGDQTPSILPTLDAVEASLKTLPELGCFTKR